MQIGSDVIVDNTNFKKLAVKWNDKDKYPPTLGKKNINSKFYHEQETHVELQRAN